MKAFALSACLISLHLDALFCGEDLFPHACLDEALIGITTRNMSTSDLLSVTLEELVIDL